MRRVLFASLFLTFSHYMVAQDVAKELDKFQLFFNSLDEMYVDSIAADELMEKAIRAVLEELDPHSVYMTPSQYAASNAPLQGKYTGIGVRYKLIDDTVTVLEVYPGGPAEGAGITAGDQLIAANGDTLSGKQLRNSEINATLQGTEDEDRDKSEAEATARLNTIEESEDPTPLRLEVWRNGGQERKSIEVIRGTIETSSVPTYFMISDGIGYIPLQRFSLTSHTDVRNAIEDLKRDKMEGLIIDLRGNGGGYLTIANKIVDEFLDDRRMIVFTEGVHQERKETHATSGGKFVKGDLVVLIDEHSASASEVFAGAIQDWDRGLIIGRRSYGKGLVQRTVEFSDGSAMRVTVSRYYTPTGRSIQKSYEEGRNAYKNDLKERARSGELYSADSIKVDDSEVFYTPLQRKVYGGGGIVPDVFVPADSSSLADWEKESGRLGLMDGFALATVRLHGAELLTEFPTVDAYIAAFHSSETLQIAYLNYLSRHGVAVESMDERAKSRFERELKEALSRYLYGYEAYYQVVAHGDRVVQTALEAFEKNTFRDVGLNH